MTPTKEQYFAAHWGQEAFRCAGILWKVGIHTVREEGHLELRSIKDLTDEELFETGKILKGEQNLTPGEIQNLLSLKTYIIQVLKGSLKSVEIKDMPQSSEIYDYLRSISIAIPYCGLSVEQLIERGWLKIKK